MTPSEKLYREIPLTKGQVAIVDAADYEWLKEWKWQAFWNPPTKSYYASRRYWTDERNCRSVAMHRVILGLALGEVRQGDHINHDTLDNRRSNLRLATRQENQINKRMRSDNTTGFKGVCWVKGKLRWRAEIQVNKKRHHLGYFPTAEEAYAVYVAAAPKYHGEFARLA